MTELALMRTPAGALAPADGPTADYVSKLTVGKRLHGKFTKQRNPKFHAKVFALFTFAFEIWDAPDVTYRGQRVEKEFERFRKDLTILAGHYETSVRLDGTVRLEAKSLAFGNMDDDEFGAVFRGLLDVVWKKVLKDRGYESAEYVEKLVDELLSFDS